MKNIVRAILAVAVHVGSAHAGGVDLGEGKTALDPIVHGTLAVMPVVAAARGAAPDVATLDEAQAAGLVKVHEREGGAEVNRLELENRGKKPLLILAGEMVKGGRQDRILGKDVVIPPGARVDVHAFCVEQGRWRGGREFKSGGWAANAKVRYEAKKESQSGVWTEVQRKLVAAGTVNSTSALREAAEKNDAGGEAALRAIEGALDRHARKGEVVGYVAAVGGKIVSVDMFAHPSLAARYRTKLLKSYVLESVGAPKTDRPAAPAAEDVRKLADKAAKARPKKSTKMGDFSADEAEGDDVVRSSVKTKDGTKLLDSIQQQ